MYILLNEKKILKQQIFIENVAYKIRKLLFDFNKKELLINFLKIIKFQKLEISIKIFQIQLKQNYLEDNC